MNNIIKKITCFLHLHKWEEKHITSNFEWEGTHNNCDWMEKVCKNCHKLKGELKW